MTASSTESASARRQTYSLPDERGHFCEYGGIFVAETLMQPLVELREAYERYRNDPDFVKVFVIVAATLVFRPSRLYLA